MPLDRVKTPLPVGSFSKTNPPKIQDSFHHFYLPHNHLTPVFQTKIGGFLSQKHMFWRSPSPKIALATTDFLHCSSSSAHSLHFTFYFSRQRRSYPSRPSPSRKISIYDKIKGFWRCFAIAPQEVLVSSRK